MLGAKNGKAAKFAQEIGLNPVFSGTFVGQSLIIVDDPAKLSASMAEVSSAVKAGARVLCLELPKNGLTFLPSIF